jgi:hypothetical protein
MRLPKDVAAGRGAVVLLVPLAVPPVLPVPLLQMLKVDARAVVQAVAVADCSPAPAA